MPIGTKFKDAKMSRRKPNHRFAPAVIAGVTIGFLVAGYQLVFGGNKPKQAHLKAPPVERQPEAQDDSPKQATGEL